MKNSIDMTFNISLHLCECYPIIHLHEGNWLFALHDPTSLLIGQLALCEVFFTIKITNHLKIHETQHWDWDPTGPDEPNTHLTRAAG